MKKVILYIILFLLLVFIIMQFFQPDKPREEITNNHLYLQNQVPENIQAILRTSCLDCHSDQTNYLWYHYVMPAGWMVNKHITDGKAELNLSNWGDMELLEQLTALEKICEEVENGDMPLKQYLLIHRNAKLTDEQKELLCGWTDKLSEELLMKLAE
jgi:hypothetical protein